jgi:hypothetical protein
MIAENRVSMMDGAVLQQRYSSLRTHMQLCEQFIRFSSAGYID